MPIALAAEAHGTTNGRLQFAHSPPTALVSTTWWATSGHGPKIVTTTTTTARLGTARPRRATAGYVWSAAVPGGTFRRGSARPLAASAPPSMGTIPWACGLGGRFY